MKRNPRQLKKQKKNVRLFRIARSNLQEGDTLVVKTSIRVAPETMEKMSSYLGCHVLILPPDGSLHIVRTQKSAL